MPIYCKRCTNDDDYEQACLFLLHNRRELHPDFTTIDMITVIYSYITEGRLILITDTDGQVIGIIGYYYGTLDLDFKDEHEVVYVDNVFIAKAHRRTRVFIHGFQYLISQIIRDHPEVQEFRFAAPADNVYLQRLYSKFTHLSDSHEGILGRKHIYSVEMQGIYAFLEHFGRI